MLKRILAAGVCIGAVASAGGAAFAQAPQAAAEEDNRNPTIIVTAQRREQDLQDVPIATTVFSGEEFDALQISEVLDIVDYIPNFVGHNNTGLGSANVYFIRGLGNVESIATFDPAVGTYVDEIFIARQNGNNASLFDIEAIEVLRGPQGTLFGRNTTGGAVVLRTKRPQEEFGGFLEASYGRFDRYQIRGSLDLPLSDRILTKVSGFWVDDDGFVDNLVTGERLNGQDAFGVRADVRLLLTDNIKFDLFGDYVEDNGLNILNTVEGGSVLIPPSNAGRRVSNTGLSTARNDGAPLARILAGEGLGQFNTSWSISGNLEVDLKSAGVFNLIAGYRNLEQIFTIDFFDGGLAGQGFPFGGFTIANDGQHEQLSVELKYFNSFLDGKLDFTSGVYYFSEDNTTVFADVFTIQPGPAPIPLTLANRRLENAANSIAVYAQGDYRLLDPLTLTIGVRWTQEEKDIAFADLRSPAPANPAVLLTSANILANGIPLEQTTSLVTPRFVLSYDFSEDVSIFASATNGFKSGGWNARGTTPSTLTDFDRERVWSYELGFRSEWLDRRLRFNATGFYTEVDGAQIISGVNTPAGITFLTDNFADQEIYGLELDSQLSLGGLTVFGSIGVQDSLYRNIDPSVLAQQSACLAALAASAATLNLCEAGIVTPTGQIADPVRIPPLTIAGGGRYDFEIPSLRWVLTPSLNLRYTGSHFVATDNQPLARENGYFVVNAGVTLFSPAQGWQVVAECTNCTDTVYIQSDLSNTLYLNEPRRWSIRVKYDF